MSRKRARFCRGLIELCVVVSIGGCSKVDMARTPRWEFLRDQPHCHSTVIDLLERWHATNEVFRAPSIRAATVEYRIATENLGVWVSVQLAGPNAAVLSLIQDREVQHVALDSTCAVATATTVVDEPDGFVFSDANLKTELEQATNDGMAMVVYVWSPHMPLSVNGYSEIAAVTKDLGLRLVPVLHAASDQTFATSEAGRVGIPNDGLRELHATELIFRDAHVHAPTILVFSGKRVSPVLPGYRNAEGYRGFIEDFLRGERSTEIDN